MWQACEFLTTDENNLPDHPWLDGGGNKIAYNILHPHPLPSIGKPEALWDELLDIEYDLSSKVSYETKLNIYEFLKNCPKPIYTVHTRGHSLSHLKSFPRDREVEVINDLLKRGTVIYVSYEKGEPDIKHENFKIFRGDIESLYWLIYQSDWVIGVDSGVFHLARLTPTPRIGCWFRLDPLRYCLPSPETINLINPTVSNLNMVLCQ